MLYPEKLKNHILRLFVRIYSTFAIPGSIGDERAHMDRQLAGFPCFAKYGTDPDLFPYTDKEWLPDYVKSIRRKPCSVLAYSSGTTGMPVSFYRDLRSIAVEQYYMDNYACWNNQHRIFMRGEKFIRPEEDPAAIYKDLPSLKEFYISSYHLRDDRMPAVVEALQTKKNCCLWAYPSTAHYLADYCLRKNITLPVKSVVLSSETLTSHQAEVIGKAFGCRVKDWYGQAERVAALYRCEAGCYHVPDGYSRIEFKPAREGTFEIVGTTLHNRIMPIVRYRTGDMVELLEGKCLCGREDPVVIKRILGRASSIIDSGGRSIPECVTGCTLKESKNVSNFQIHVMKSGKVRYDIVINEQYGKEDERLVRKLIGDVFAPDAFEIRYVREIQKTESGKQQMVVRE